MTKVQLVQILSDYFGFSLEEYGGYVTEENVNKILESYDFISGASIGYGGPRLSLSEVVRALEGVEPDDYRVVE